MPVFSHNLLPPGTPRRLENPIPKIALGILAGLLVHLLAAAKRAGGAGGPARRAAAGRQSNGSNLILRPATPDDAPAIARLAHQLGYPTSALQAGARLQAIAALPDHLVLVAVSDGMVCGWMHVHMARSLESDAFAEIGGIVIDRACRGRGVGHRLLLAAQAWCAARELSLLRVRSRSDRSAAHAFYLKQGFVRSKEQYVFDKAL